MSEYNRKLHSEKVAPARTGAPFIAVVETKGVPHIDPECGSGGVSLPLFRDAQTPHTFEQGTLPNLLVEVHGSNGELQKVPLPAQFSQRATWSPPPSEFKKYLSKQLGEDVTGVFYTVRGDRAVGRKNSLTLQRFEMDEGTTAYPFVGGMKILVCVDGAESIASLSIRKSSKYTSGCSVM